MKYLLVLLLAVTACKNIPCAKSGQNCNLQACCSATDLCVNSQGENAGQKACVTVPTVPTVP